VNDAVDSAELQRGIARNGELVSERTRAAMAHMAVRGEYTGGQPRYGFRLAGDGLRLEVVDAEQIVIAETRRLHDEGRSDRAVARALTAAGYRGRTGRPFSGVQVKRMLERPTAPRAAKAESAALSAWQPTAEQNEAANRHHVYMAGWRDGASAKAMQARQATHATYGVAYVRGYADGSDAHGLAVAASHGATGYIPSATWKAKAST
jgi:hypothetical protein